MQEFTKEMWKPVRGYENLYEVSNLGKVRSLDRLVNGKCRSTRLVKGLIVSPAKDRGGYLRIMLSKGNNQNVFSVHRLVYEAFNGQIPEGMQVNHIDEDKSNNSLENLNLMTPKQNINWGTGIERRSKSQINHKKFSKPIIQYNRQGIFIAEYPSQCEVERKLGINRGAIGACCKGRRKTAGGFKWTYKEQ